MLIADIIGQARDGRALSRAAIETLIEGFTAGTVPDYQMAAFAMAVRIRGLPASSIEYLTTAMLRSGDVLPRGDGPPRVDKHSTGGLGDKVSLILAPLLACCGVRVPMISGRGLGLSGGTLDKLESIPGFQVDFSSDESLRLLDEVGCFIVGASDRVAPADRRLYALRDVTGCVESVALITASILSKKLAASLDALVMDVKVGSGAFMKTTKQATELAESLIRTGGQAGLPVRALITNMDQPLGHAVGNANEVAEAISVLRGDGPADVREVTLALCAELLPMVGVTADEAEATRRLAETLDSGRAHERWLQMVAAQGGDPEAALPRYQPMPIPAPMTGWVASIDSEGLGRWIVEQGGGRRQMSDVIDHAVGVDLVAKVGDHVMAGEPLATAQSSQPIDCDRLAAMFRIKHSPVAMPPPIASRIVALSE